MFQPNIQMPTSKTIISTTTSVAAATVLIRAVTKEYLPFELQYYISQKIRSVVSKFSSQVTIVINEFDGMVGNQLFHAIDLYLGTTISPLTQRFRATIPIKETHVHLSMDKNQEASDIFNGVKLAWRRVAKQVDVSSKSHYYSSHPLPAEIQYFELSFHKKHKDMVLTIYFQHILNQSKAALKKERTPKLHTLNNDRYNMNGGAWQWVNLDHPATFETLAMDTEMKKMIMEDLERFVKRKEFYRKVGKAWKRGFLLFGPPGTGKSSLIAAIANYLKFDIYDLELADIRQNSDLRRLLIATANRSILVVEDIDCSIDLQTRTKKSTVSNPDHPESYQQRNEVTLSGLLNFIDGLWSSCGDERIIIFTTNHKDRLDPALLRPGRMDVHIHMSYCTPSGLKTLTLNYLGITNHPLLTEIEQLLQVTSVTPAEVGEQLMKNDDTEMVLRGLMTFLVEKIRSDDLKSNQLKEVAAKARREIELEEENIRSEQ